MDREFVLKRHDELVAIRRPEEPIWREIARVIQPDERAIGDGAMPKADPYEDIFDSSPLYANETFAGGMFSQATNPTTDWFDLGFEDPELKAWGPARDYIGAMKAQVVASLSPMRSSFYVEAYPWFANVGAFGLSALYDEPDFARGSFVERVIPLSETYIDVDAWGRVDTFNRAFTLRGRQVAQKFGSLPNIDERRDYRFIHHVGPNPDFDGRPGRLGLKAMPWISVNVSPDIKDFITIKGYYEFPYHVISWSRRPGRVYPRGPGHLARPDASMLQEMERSHLVGMQFRAEPPLMTTEEAAITASDIRPNAVLYGAMNDQGKQLVQPLSLGEDLAASQQHAELKRQSIRDAFMFSLMNLVNRPQMTATEVMAFQEERLRLMAPNLVRVQTALASFIGRRIRMLERLGMMPEPPADLVGSKVQVEFVSPLAKAQKSATGRATMQWVNSVAQIAQFQPEALDAIDVDAVNQVTHDAFGPPPSVIRSQEKIDEIRQARAQQAMQAQQLAAAEQAAGIYAEVSHANQASTKAQERKAPVK